jgi:photosystem II stability/assembly factor-like uncharacterized protein
MMRSEPDFRCGVTLRRPGRWCRRIVAAASCLAVVTAGLAGTSSAGARGPGQPVPVRRAHGWVVGWNPADGYGAILHTTNGGRKWVRQGSARTVPNVGFGNVAAVDRHVAWVVGQPDSGYGVILRTFDGGRRWVRQGRPGMVPDAAIFGVDTADRRVAWVVGQQGLILRTVDAGRTWIPQVSGTTADLYEVAVVDRSTAWAAGNVDNGYVVILRTTNGGRTWKRQGTAATLAPTQALIDLTAVNARVAWVVGTDQFVAKTTDGGASWQAQMSGGLSHNNGVCAVDRNRAWIATDYNVVRRTIGGGQTWDMLRLSWLPGAYYLLGVSALGPNAAWVVGGAMYPPDRGIIIRTSNGGTTWRIQHTPVNVTFRRASFVGSKK